MLFIMAFLVHDKTNAEPKIPSSNAAGTLVHIVVKQFFQNYVYVLYSKSILLYVFSNRTRERKNSKLLKKDQLLFI